MAKAFTIFVGLSILVWAWLVLTPKPARVDIDWQLGERFTSRHDNPNDPHSYRERWMVYDLTNLENERSVTMLRFVCGPSKTEFEPRDIPPHARVNGKLRVLGGDIHFDADSCEPEFKITSEKVF